MRQTSRFDSEDMVFFLKWHEIFWKKGKLLKSNVFFIEITNIYPVKLDFEPEMNKHIISLIIYKPSIYSACVACYEAIAMTSAKSCCDSP